MEFTRRKIAALIEKLVLKNVLGKTLKNLCKSIYSSLSYFIEKYIFKNLKSMRFNRDNSIVLEAFIYYRKIHFIKGKKTLSH